MANAKQKIYVTSHNTAYAATASLTVSLRPYSLAVQLAILYSQQTLATRERYVIQDFPAARPQGNLLYYIDHSQEICDLLQSTGHEACERWQSKGFVDVQLSKYYLQLMGQSYQGSQLDKLRLKHRMKEETNAGHPWDGEREFIAELESALLVDPSVSNKLFDSMKDQIALEALDYLKTKLNIQS